MPYARRDRSGNIIELRLNPVDDQDQYVTASDPAVLALLLDPGREDTAREYLAASDPELARVLEDLVSVLAKRGLTRFTDLPPLVQHKLGLRQRARTAMQDNEPFSLDGEELL